MTSNLRQPVLLALFVFAAAVQAETFTGTITGVATVGAPGSGFHQYYELGDTWTLGYSYTSDSADGVFSATRGNLRIWRIDGLIDLHEYSTGLFGSSIPTLGVVNGQVTEFYGSSVMWEVWEDTWSFDRMGGGTVFISAPRAVAAPEPTAIAVVPPPIHLEIFPGELTIAPPRPGLQQ